MDPLFALSIRQPWMDMILRNEKTIELRAWEIRRLGSIALHAAWGIDWKAAALFGYSQPLELPRGVIVGRTEISSVMKLDRESWYRLVDQHLVIHPLSSGIYAAFLGKVERLPSPIRFRGRQYFFPLPPTAVEEINRQLQVPLD